MGTDLWLMLSLAIVGILDVNLERYTGRGLIARAQDFIERRKTCSHG